jgi:8-hydroxy-5-deazaflavin:NADPH oxidoreductase
MKIMTVGRGSVGGGLADLWEKAGHEVERIGKDGGDVAEADALLVAVPGGAIADALANVAGLEGKTAIDATNLVGADRPPGFQSNAEFVKSKTNGPTAKGFSLNFARIYSDVEQQPIRPGNICCGDDEARDVAEQLSRDAGYELVWAGGLDKARALEDGLAVVFAVMQAGGGPVFYRIWKPGEL